MKHLLLLLFCVLVFGCSRAGNSLENSKTAVSTPKRNRTAPEGYMNVNGVLFTDEENLEMSRKMEQEKKRRNLSDKDALIMSEKMWDEFLAKKRKQQPANNNR